MRKKVILLLILCLGLNMFSCFAGLFDLPIEYKNISLDVASHYPYEAFLVIKDKTELDRLIAACKDDSAIGRNIEVPKINFKKHMLIAVLGGRNTATSYSITIDEIKVVDDKVIVSVLKNGPQREIDRPNVTSPYHIVLIPKTSLEVKFLINGTPCEYSTVDSLRMH